MLPLSAKDPLPFRPREDGPTYLVKPATLYERAAFRRAVAQKGARYPADRELFAALREGIAETAPEDQREALLAVVDGAEAVLKAGERLEGKEAELFAAVADTVRSAGGRYAALEAERHYYLDVAPLVAAEMFLVGREGEDALPRRGGALAPGALDAVDERDVVAIGYEAIRLMSLSEDDRKNSASGSRSSSSPTPSTTTPATAAGRSSATATTRTRPKP